MKSILPLLSAALLIGCEQKTMNEKVQEGLSSVPTTETTNPRGGNPNARLDSQQGHHDANPSNKTDGAGTSVTVEPGKTNR